MDREVIKSFAISGEQWISRNKIRVEVAVTFVLLALLTWAVVAASLYSATKNFRDNYYRNLEQRLEVADNILLSTAGEIALLNLNGESAPIFSPYVLDVSAIDVQNPRKAFDSAAQSGCLVSFGNSELCAALGNQPNVGSYLYIVGWIDADDIAVHNTGDPVWISHQIKVHTKIRGEESTWLIVFQDDPKRRMSRLGTSPAQVDLYATGYRQTPDGSLANQGRDEKELKGRLNYASNSSICKKSPCTRRWQFSFRVPVDAFRAESLIPEGLWPPKDFKSLRVDVQIIAPAKNNEKPSILLDSNNPLATRKYSMNTEIGARFKEEYLQLFKAGDRNSPLWESYPLIVDSKQTLWSHIARSILAPVTVNLAINSNGYDHRINGRLGSYDLVVRPSESIESAFLLPLASQLVLILFLTTLLMVFAWLYLRQSVVQRIRVLTDRTEALAAKLKNDIDVVDSPFLELQGRDELGVLASGIHDLLGRMNEHLRIRKSNLDRLHGLWSAIGHEINSPLQSLAALHPEGRANDKSRQYITRMRDAIEVMRSAGSLEAASWEVNLKPIDLNDYLNRVIINATEAPHLPPLEYINPGAPVWILGDEDTIDSVLENVLDNANRYKSPDSHVLLSLKIDTPNVVTLRIFNDGPPIPEDSLEKVFDLGFTERAVQNDLFIHGQGLFMARQKLTSLGGTISASNCEPNGVEFLIRLIPTQPDR